MKKQRNYDKGVKLTRILLADYLKLKKLSDKVGVSMAQCLHVLITGQPFAKTEAEIVAELKAERERISRELLTEVAKIAKPVAVAHATPAFMPKSMSSDEDIPIRLKFIKGDEDNRVKLKSIR
ncbi:hypothetical protein ES705_19049 [subsurface metagenome]